MKRHWQIIFTGLMFILSGCSVQAVVHSDKEEKQLSFSFLTENNCCLCDMQSDASKNDEKDSDDIQKCPVWKSDDEDENNDRLSRNEVSNEIHKIFPEIRECARISPEKGKMLVSFVIDEQGAVREVRGLSKEFEKTRVSSCVFNVVRSMKFRATGKRLPIKYPFLIQ